MDYELGFLSSIVRDGRKAVLTAKEHRISPEDLSQDHQSVLEYIYDYVTNYEGVPDATMVALKTGVPLEETPGSSDFFIKEMVNKKLFTSLQKGLTKASVTLGEGKPREVLDDLDSLLREIRQTIHIDSSLTSLFEHSGEVLDYYKKVKSGYRGILTRWPTVNDATLGFWPQDFILFVARTSGGKSFASVIIAHDAWARTQNNKKVLFITTELTRSRIAERFYAVHLKLPYRQFRQGKLGALLEGQLFDKTKELEGAKGFYVAGGDFDYSIGGLEAAIEKVQPDLVIVDGAYLIKNRGQTRHERAANTFDDMKRIAQRYNIVLLATTQLNRSANPNQKATITTEAIALSDTAGWNADMCVGMVQTEELKRNQRMLFKFLKIREGIADEMELNWNFDHMDFSEIKTSPVDGDSNPFAGPGDADESGLSEGSLDPDDDHPF